MRRDEQISVSDALQGEQNVRKVVHGRGRRGLAKSRGLPERTSTQFAAIHDLELKRQ